MCGFVVLVNGSVTGPPAVENLSPALDAIRHRGPDDGRQAVVGPCTFGYQRLAIIDTDGSPRPLRYPADGPQARRSG